MSIGILLNHSIKTGLPDSYQECEWIRSYNLGGAQHIDTGYTPNNTTRVVCKIAWNGYNNSLWGGFGAATSATSNAFECFVYSGYINWNFNTETYGASGGLGYSYTQNMVYNIDANRNVMTIKDSGGSVLKTITATDGTFTAPYTMYLFGSHRASSGHGFCTIYGHVYIYNDDLLVREYIPCWRKADGVIGMYDMVSGTFKENEGTGTFEAGPKVAPHTLPAEYRLVSYIGTTGTQYLITDYTLFNLATWGFYLDFSYSQTSTNRAIWASTVLGTVNEGWMSSGRELIYRYGNSRQSVGYTNWDTRLNTYACYEGGKFKVQLNGTETVNVSVNQSAENSKLVLWYRTNYATAKTYGLKIYSYGEIVREYVPCVRISDSVAGLYDVLHDNSTYLTNAGTGSFVVGEL